MYRAMYRKLSLLKDVLCITTTATDTPTPSTVASAQPTDEELEQSMQVWVSKEVSHWRFYPKMYSQVVRVVYGDSKWK